VRFTPDVILGTTAEMVHGLNSIALSLHTANNVAIQAAGAEAAITAAAAARRGAGGGGTG
jgi:hypothetical protein